MKRIRILYLFLFSLFLHDFAYADQVGSDVLVSVVAYTNFGTPVITQNEMLSFGWMKNGFGMDDDTITSTFRSVFPVSGHLSLHGGQLTLGTDMTLNNPILFASPGIIHGDNHIFDIAQSVTALPSSDRLIFKDTNIFFNNDLYITGTIDFKGTCVINGGKNRIILGTNGNLKIGHNSTLTLKNVEIDGVKNFNIYCMDDSASLILDNVRWVQSSDYTLSSGSISIQNLVEFSCKYKFTYSSGLTSTIGADSTWYFSDLAQVVFGRKRGYTDREPLYFEDYSSILRLENATLVVTSSGATLTRGTFLCDREVQVDVDSLSQSGALALGDGNAANDPYVKLFPASALKLVNGMLAYNVVGADNFLNDEIEVKFIRTGNSIFLALQDINFNNVDIQSDLTSQFSVSSGVSIDFNNCLITNPYGSYRLSAYNYDIYSFLLGLDGDSKSVVMSNGVFPNWLHIKNSGNSLSGTGDMGGDIIFHDSNARLTVSLDGKILGNTYLNGGTLILGKDLNFDDDLIISGTGTIDLASYICSFGHTDLNWTSSISWTGQSGKVYLNGNMVLSSELVFYGDSYIDGNGRSLSLMPTASIKVGSGGKLHLRNINLRNINTANISCIDDSGSIILENAQVDFDNIFTWTKGSLRFVEIVDFSGTTTVYYQSGLTSTLDKHTRLTLHNNVAFEIGRKNGFDDREPFYFEDSTSTLAVDAATLVVTSSGMRFTRGSLEMLNTCIIDLKSTSSKGGLQIGDGTPTEDFQLTFDPGSSIRFKEGHFVYNDSTPYSIKSFSDLSRIIIDPGFNIYVNTSLEVKNITVSFTGLWNTVIASGSTLSYNKANVNILGNEFILTGQRYSSTVLLLPGNGTVTLTAGAVPIALLATGANNRITGSGRIVAPVTLANSSATLTWDLLGQAGSAISLGGGTLTLTKPLVFTDNILVAGTGKVNVSSNSVSMGGLSLVGTSTTYWDCNGGSVLLRSDLKLTSAWTFSGNCVIDGAGSSIIFNPTGKLIIERGSTVRFKNIAIKGLNDGQLFCVNNAGKVIFNNTVWAQDSNVTFSHGSFEVIDVLTMEGKGSTFSYKSTRQSVIDPRATLNLLSDFTLSYEPLSTARNLIYLSDRTSKIVMESASLSSTSTGLQLTNGYLEVHGDCYLYSNAAYQPEGIIFGDGMTEDSDLKIDIFQESNLQILSGYLTYKNVA